MKLILKINNSIDTICLLERTAEKWLEASAKIIENQVRNNSSVKTGKTRNGWTYKVIGKEKTAIIGNPLKNALWEEFGTGEYALNGKGRKGGWFYQDEKKSGHFTYGKPPKRSLYNAFNQKKYEVIKLAEKLFREELK